MFTKVLFFILLGCALAYADPGEEVKVETQVQNVPLSEKVQGWYQSVKEKIAKFNNKVKVFFKGIWDYITGKSKAREHQEKLNHLKEQYEALRVASAEAIEAKKAKWDQVLAETESKLSYLRKKADLSVDEEIHLWDVKFNKLKEEAEEVIKSLNYKK